MNRLIREPINALTHLLGAILSLIGLIAMIIKIVDINPNILGITSVIIFGISLVLLYLTSATYHTIISSDRVINFLRRLDHSMIFVLIAGSYAPFCLISLKGWVGSLLFFVIITLALCGIIFKMTWFNCPRILSTSIYIFMGWIVIFAVKPLLNCLSGAGLNLLVAGGILYTVGGVIYTVKPKLLKSKYLGYHEIFHIFILLGSLCHFLCIYLFVI